MQFTYDFGLASLSVAIAVLATFTSLVMTTRLRNVSLRDAAIRIAFAGLALGSGFWATDIIAMAAVSGPVEMHYSPIIAGFAATIAVLFATAALAFVGFNTFGPYTLPAATLFLGTGLIASHQLGLAALHGEWRISLSWHGAAVAGLIAFETAAIALWFAFRERGVLDTALAALVVALAAASAQYLGMDAVRLLPSAGTAALLRGTAPNWPTALVTAAFIYCLCSISLLVFCALTFRRPALRIAQPRRLQTQV